MFSKTDIEKYFLAEKQGSLLFLVIGVIAVIAALIFFFGIKTSFYKGVAVPLIILGLIMGMMGYSIYSKADEARKKMVYAYDMNPGEIKEKEIPRMEKLVKSFPVYKYAEGFLVIIGLFLFFYFKNGDTNISLKGVGAGLAIIAAIALFVELAAASRGEAYLKGLQQWVGTMKSA